MKKRIMTLMTGMLLLLTACGQTGDRSASTMLPVAAVQSAAQAIAPVEDKVQEDKLTEQLRAAKQAKSRILNQDGDDTIPCTQELITILNRGPETLCDFDGELFGQLIDKVIIESNTSLRFRLKNGLELRESIERTAR